LGIGRRNVEILSNFVPRDDLNIRTMLYLRGRGCDILELFKNKLFQSCCSKNKFPFMEIRILDCGSM
jgi:hypothetical protein